MTLYYSDDSVTLHHGDMREILPTLDVAPDCAVIDPPYAETSLAWDRWPDGWPSLVAKVTSSMWCFGSLRMFLDRRDEFADWRLSQDVVWEKHNGSGFSRDRFRRVHEIAAHWYQGHWSNIYHEVPRELAVFKRGGKVSINDQHSPHMGTTKTNVYIDDGTRLVRSVLRAPSVRRGIHQTQKPVEILRPLIEYGCPPGGIVLDPFAGSGSTAEAARQSGRRAVLIEANERYCEATARRLAQDVLPIGGAR